MAMKHESLFRSVASGLLIAMVTKIMATVMSISTTVDKLSYDVPNIYLRLDRQRAKIEEFDTRIRVCEIKQGDRSHGRN